MENSHVSSIVFVVFVTLYSGGAMHLPRTPVSGQYMRVTDIREENAIFIIFKNECFASAVPKCLLSVLL